MDSVQKDSYKKTVLLGDTETHFKDYVLEVVIVS